MRKNLIEKILESLASVAPVTLIVLILSVTICPVSGEMMFIFFIGAIMLVLGIGMFTMGADTSMLIMGEKIGSGIVKTRKLWLVILSCLMIGVLITVAEPDLRVLAEQAPIAENMTLILCVAAGVGVFLLLAFLRILLQWRLSFLLIGLYAVVFALVPLVPVDFIPAAFDSGGVTTGPITVPFIMSLGLGLAAIRGDRSTMDDTFGLVAMCSIGPILTVLLLGAFSGGATMEAGMPSTADYGDGTRTTRDVMNAMLAGLPEQLADVAMAVAPIIVMCMVFQFALIRLNKSDLLKAMIGFGFTYAGLVLFLTGANFGFMPIGTEMGKLLAENDFKWLLIPIGAVVGYFIVAAEPAVVVLKQQVEEITERRISAKAMGLALAIGVAASVALAMIRVLTGISILWFLIPGYAFSLAMTFFVPKIFTAVAFDAGGVASGPMTATFLLPFAMGACVGLNNGDTSRLATDAFGVVAMVAMTPLITIQSMGLIARIKSAMEAKSAHLPALLPEDEIIDADDIIDTVE
jgi:hypothetical protein